MQKTIDKMEYVGPMRFKANMDIDIVPVRFKANMVRTELGQTIATLIIQRFWRKWFYGRDYVVRKVQARWRGVLLRKALRFVVEETQAARKLQVGRGLDLCRDVVADIFYNVWS